MANTILLKRNSTAAVSPAAVNLAAGELAINTADGRLFAKNSAGNVVNLPVTSISGQAITPASVQTSGTADGIKIQAGGTANSRVITLQPTTLGGNRTLTLPDATAELAMTFNPLAVTGTSPFANQKRGTIRNNFDDPTTEEAALFHGQFYNQLRFISPALQEESADGGTTWTTSTRLDATTLGNMMRGQGEGTSVSIIPSGSATPLGYRLTWDDTVTGLVYWSFSHLYINCSTNGNLTTFKIEAFHNTNGWTEIFTGTANNYPGHVSIKHNVIAYYPTNAGAYGKLRVTFTASTPTTAVTMYAMEWFGGYPNGKRNAESYDRSKNVTFPAAINTSTGYRISNGATAGQYLRGNGTQFVSSGIQAGDVPTLNQNTTGSAATLTTGRTLWGQSFNGSANVSGNITTAANIEQSWADYRVGTFYDNSYRMGFNYITASRVLNIFSTAAATGGAAGGVISFSTRVAVGASDTDYGTERMRITNTGLVGIGTNDPQDRLHLNGAQTTMRLQSTNAYDTQFRLIDTASDWGVGLNIANTLGNGMFCIRSHTAGAHRLVIDTTGRVGIANAVPYARLNVGAKVVDDNSYTYDTNSLVVTHQTAASTSVLNDPKEVLLLARQGTSGQAFGAAASFQLSRYENSSTNARTRLDLVLGHTNFMTSPTTVLTARSDGNVGVGNTAPGSRLVVKGAGATSATSALNVTNSADTSLLAVRDDGLTTFTGQISNTLAVGTAPLAVTSTTVCTNLNADTVDGQHASAFAAAQSFTVINASTVTLTAARDAFYRYALAGNATTTLPTASQLNGDIVCILVGTYVSGSLTIAGAVTGTDVLSAAGQQVTYQYVSGVGGGWFKLPVDVHTHGNITSDGKVGAVSGRVLVTTTAGAVTAADVINGSLVSLIANSGVADLGPDTMSASFLQYVYDSNNAQARSVIGAASATHTHGSVTNDGKIGSATGQVITTGSAGVLQASATLPAANLPAPQRLSSYCSGLFFG